MYLRTKLPVLVLGDSSFVARILLSGDFKRTISFFSMRDSDKWTAFCHTNRETGISIIWCIKTRPVDDEFQLLTQLINFLSGENIRFSLIYLSSFAVYKPRQRVSDPKCIGTISDYGRVKAQCENLLREVSDETSSAISVTCLRLASFYDQRFPNAGIAPYVAWVTRNFPAADPAFVFEAYGVDELLKSVGSALSQSRGFGCYDVAQVISWAEQPCVKRRLSNTIFWKLLIPLGWLVQRVLPVRLRVFLGLFARR